MNKKIKKITDIDFYIHFGDESENRTLCEAKAEADINYIFGKVISVFNMCVDYWYTINCEIESGNNLNEEYYEDYKEVYEQLSEIYHIVHWSDLFIYRAYIPNYYSILKQINDLMLLMKETEHLWFTRKNIKVIREFMNYYTNRS